MIILTDEEKSILLKSCKDREEKVGEKGDK